MRPRAQRRCWKLHDPLSSAWAIRGCESETRQSRAGGLIRSTAPCLDPWSSGWPSNIAHGDHSLAREATLRCVDQQPASLSVGVMVVRVVSLPASAGRQSLRFCWHQRCGVPNLDFLVGRLDLLTSSRSSSYRPSLHIKHCIMHVQKGCDPVSKVSRATNTVWMTQVRYRPTAHCSVRFSNHGISFRGIRARTRTRAQVRLGFLWGAPHIVLRGGSKLSC